jgi:tetratricopeptide (TPR) repeat protein
MEDQNLKELVQEIRKYHTWQKNLTKWISIALSPFLLVCLVMAVLEGFKVGPFRESPDTPPLSGRDFDAAMSQAELPKALDIAKRLETKAPTDFMAQWRLGRVYLALGNQQEAERHYAKAYEILPDKQAEDQLAAVRKAIRLREQKDRMPNQASEATGAPGASPPER